MTEFSSLKKSCDVFSHQTADYYKQWLFDQPVFISHEFYSKMSDLHILMQKLITEFVTNYKAYKHLMPVSDRVERIISIFNDNTYEIGTYRTDFVFDAQSEAKIIEITCRFALNGLFLSSVLQSISSDFAARHLPNIKFETPYEEFYAYFETLMGDATTIWVLRGGDLRNEFKIYEDILNRTGRVVKSVQVDQIPNHLTEMQNCLIISELSLEEIESLPDETLAALAQLNVLNDFRTVFLIHDKRFFAVLGDTALQKAALSQAEQRQFAHHYIPSFCYGDNDAAWADARRNKDGWILKHRALGKSQSVYAGITLPADEWDDLFDKADIHDYVIQEWIGQTRVSGSINGAPFQDYITGTLLYFNDQFFGFGDFRTSSHPVTNKVDHRKACYLTPCDPIPVPQLFSIKVA